MIWSATGYSNGSIDCEDAVIPNIPKRLYASQPVAAGGSNIGCFIFDYVSKIYIACIVLLEEKLIIIKNSELRSIFRN